jgi:RimJ/RimL family protein N-acetyltransferase
MTLLVTARLRLVPFCDDHVAGLNVLNADPEVMRYISGRPETLDETVAVVERVKRRWSTFGYSWWSFIDQGSGEIVGAGALQHLRRDVRPEPDPACPLEIGWRLRRDCWHQGLASEAARAMTGFAFDTLHVDELYAVCDPANIASARVMQRLGMQDLGLQTWYGKHLATYQTSAGQWLAAREASQAPSASASADKSAATRSNSPSCQASIGAPAPRSSGRGT